MTRRIHLLTDGQRNGTYGTGLCGRRTSLLDLTMVLRAVTCDECRDLYVSLAEGDLGSALQANPVPPQRLSFGPEG
jgi:hypothetical protein